MTDTLETLEVEEQLQSQEQPPELIKELHLFDVDEVGDYSESNVDLKSKPELKSFLVELCRHTYGSNSSRTYKFVEGSKVSTYVDKIIESPESSKTFAQKIANALGTAEKKPSFEIKEGTFIFARINADDRDVIIMSKLDFENYFSRATYEKEAGLPEEKGILKSCIIEINEDNTRKEEIRLSDKNGDIAVFWYDGFLDAEPLQKDDVNTKTAYSAIKRVISRSCADSKEDMFGLIECMNAYFMTHKEFIFDEFVEQSIKTFTPSSETVDVNEIATKLTSLKEKSKFDGQFSIVLSSIKSKIRNKIKLDDGMVLQSDGNIGDKVFKTQLDDENYLLIRTDSGIDGFKVRNIVQK
ncbi:hypothetical protein BIT28_14405 [Photobacterium proteolyticum]|uniref:Nucleoid-associated protein n=1 Tax=Photobacterium proteolyticum TaxID=1903952 RepID=A0A1Q9H1D8_9GAMM|nr:nucleoid-associated protein [Photobacterium proteolyticum]OLQ81483.1 hypothetical protein BIT28_14405 [Photobacterium proteolyticum]